MPLSRIPSLAFPYQDPFKLKPAMGHAIHPTSRMKGMLYCSIFPSPTLGGMGVVSFIRMNRCLTFAQIHHRIMPWSLRDLCRWIMRGLECSKLFADDNPMTGITKEDQSFFCTKNTAWTPSLAPSPPINSKIFLSMVPWSLATTVVVQILDYIWGDRQAGWWICSSMDMDLCGWKSLTEKHFWAPNCDPILSG